MYFYFEKKSKLYNDTFLSHFSNCSSADFDGRSKMRGCEGFIPSLLHAVNSSLHTLNEINNKSIENCMCILRNLSYKLQEVDNRDYDRNYSAMAAASTWNVTPTQYNNEQDKTKIGCMGSKQKKTKQLYDQIGIHNNAVCSIVAPPEGGSVEMLWQPDTISTYVHLLRHSSNPDTLEATAGCIQNLSMLLKESSNRKEKSIMFFFQLLATGNHRWICVQKFEKLVASGN